MTQRPLRAVVGVDTGGTFTDFVLFDGGGLRIHKEPSTPDDPARAVINGLRHLAGAERAEMIHGSTVGTNALLERRGARTVLVTTAGFEDVLEIGRQTRRSIYDINVTRVEPLVPRERRLGLSERIGPHGEVLLALRDADVRSALDEIAVLNPEGIAVCLLHSYANADHERHVANMLRDHDASWFVTASHEVLPEFREYERSSTTVINAYVGPVMRRYLGNLAEAMGGRRVSIMQSNGGVMSLEAARTLAVHTVLSGPAGGAVGGFETGRRAGYSNVISFDMGGTSTDVSLAAGAPGLTSEGNIGELPIRIPILDIHTVGAGGGSIAFRDPGGSLRVGPQSAGAQPGPICYGRGGTNVTVTDANLLLGRLSPEHFLGGQQRLDGDSLRGPIEELARSLNLSPQAAAEGIIRVANATMERAIRVISLERGHDPRDFALVCFGGAGGMHAADLARSLAIPDVIVPPAAGTLSALGMLLADFVRDYSRTLLEVLDQRSFSKLENAFAELEQWARDDCTREGLDVTQLRFQRALDMRYAGQGYELVVAVAEEGGAAKIAADFNNQHGQRYGYSDSARLLEVVNVRLRASLVSEKPVTHEKELRSPDAKAAVIAETKMVFDAVETAALVYDRNLLAPGNRISGPALVVEYSTTTVVPPDYAARVDALDNLILRPRDA